MPPVAITGSWTMTPTPDAVWDTLIDLESWASWWPAIGDARRAADAAPSPAVDLSFDTPRGVPSLVVRLTVTDARPSERLEVAVTEGPMRGQGVVSIVPDAAGSLVTYDIGLRVRSLVFRPIETVLSQASRRAGRERLARAGADLAGLCGGELIASS